MTEQQEQARISLGMGKSVGRKEVVDWLMSHGGLMDFISMHLGDEWEAKLSEWGIEA